MRKYFLVVLCILLAASSAEAKHRHTKGKLAVEAKGNTPVAAVAKPAEKLAVKAEVKSAAAPAEKPDTVEVGDVLLTVGEDYSWKTQIEDKKLVFGTAEFNEARDKCLAYEKAVKNYQTASRAGKHAEAEEAAPNYLMKAFAGLSHLRELMGGRRDASGHWSGYDVDEMGKTTIDEPKDLAQIKAEFEQVSKWVQKATKAGQTKDSKGNDVSIVQGYLDGYKSGILSDVVQK